MPARTKRRCRTEPLMHALASTRVPRAPPKIPRCTASRADRNRPCRSNQQRKRKGGSPANHAARCDSRAPAPTAAMSPTNVTLIVMGSQSSRAPIGRSASPKRPPSIAVNGAAVSMAVAAAAALVESSAPHDQDEQGQQTGPQSNGCKLHRDGRGHRGADGNGVEAHRQVRGDGRISTPSALVQERVPRPSSRSNRARRVPWSLQTAPASPPGAIPCTAMRGRHRPAAC